MKTQLWGMALLAATLLSGCFINIDDDDISIGCLNADGDYESRTLNLSEFEGVKNTTSAKVFITQGAEQEVIVEGKEDAIDELELDVRNGIWEIEFDRCVRDLDEFLIIITMPTIRHLRNTGSGDMVGENVFQLEDLEIDISGSGDVDLALNGDDIDAKLSGSGDLILEGTADESFYRISGSGDVQAFNLETRTADIRSSGSGNADVFVLELLKASLSGSGDVRYKGNPTLDVSTTGSGDVIDAN
jgi:hypothetical protein